MAELATVARPYAEAVFRSAQEQGQLGAFSDMLKLAAAIASDARMSDLLANPKHPLKTKLDAVFGVAGDKFAPAVKNLVTMLIEARRSTLLVPVSEQFESLKRDAESVLKAHITSAFPMSDAEKADMVAALTKKYGKRVEAEVSVDATLLGGARVQIGDQVVSGSVRDQLNQMASALTR